jgi:hypothetical protein
MRNTNLLALAAALILACVWAWASSTGTKAAAPTGSLDRPVPSHGESSSHYRYDFGDIRRQQLWGEPGSRAAAAGTLLAKKIFGADH